MAIVVLAASFTGSPLFAFLLFMFLVPFLAVVFWLARSPLFTVQWGRIDRYVRTLPAERNDKNGSDFSSEAHPLFLHFMTSALEKSFLSMDADDIFKWQKLHLCIICPIMFFRLLSDIFASYVGVPVRLLLPVGHIAFSLLIFLLAKFFFSYRRMWGLIWYVGMSAFVISHLDGNFLNAALNLCMISVSGLMVVRGWVLFALTSCCIQLSFVTAIVHQGGLTRELVQYMSFCLTALALVSLAAYKYERDGRMNFLLQERLAQSEDQWKQITHHCPDGVAVVSDGGIEYLNPAAETVPREQLLSTSDFQQLCRALFLPNASSTPTSASDASVSSVSPGLTHSDSARSLASNTSTNTSKQQFQTTEFVLEEEDGSTTYLEVTGNAIAWWGNPAACVMIRNITARKEAEIAKHAQKAKSMLLSYVSHELRTPLNGILGALDLVRPCVNDEGTRYLHVANRCANLLLFLVNDILDFSKMVANNFCLQQTAFSMCDLVQEAVDVVLFQANEKQLNTTFTVDTLADRKFIGDSNRIKQVLLNLLCNSIKFTYKGSIDVAVSLDAIEQDELGNNFSIVKFTVSDTGIGIAPRDRHRLFRLFGQLDEHRSTSTVSGCGFGLSLCKELCTYMGGTIGVDSYPGRGSVFWFTVRLKNESDISSDGYLSPSVLPFADDLVPVTSTTSGDDSDLGPSPSTYPLTLPLLEANSAIKSVSIRQPTSTDSTSIHTTPKRILIVDDNEFNRIVLKGMIGRDGYIIDEAVDGRTAVEAVTGVRPGDPRRATSGGGASVSDGLLTPIMERAVSGSSRYAGAGCMYDLVFMDCSMPVMDGLEATARIRKWEVDTGVPVSHRIPIVALTAFTEEASREKCLEVGMNDYASKPIKRSTLLQLLTRWTESRTRTSCSSTGSSASQLTASELLRSHLSLQPPSSLLDVEGPLQG